MTNLLVKLLAISSLAGGIGLVGGICYVLKNKLLGEDRYWRKFIRLSGKWGMKGAFIIAVGSMVGSLFLSEVANFEACLLCWIQRGLMYPLTVFLGMGIMKEIKIIRKAGLGMSLIGMLFAGYQYYLQITHNPLAPCSTSLFSASCSKSYVWEFGFVTIPFMALVGFGLIALLLYFSGVKVEKE